MREGGYVGNHDVLLIPDQDVEGSRIILNGPLPMRIFSRQAGLGEVEAITFEQ